MTTKSIKIACINCKTINSIKKAQSLDLKAPLVCTSCDQGLFPYFDQPFSDLSPAAFIHHLDRQMLDALKNIPGVDSVLRSLLRHSFELSMRLHHQGNFLKASAKQAKSLYQKLEHAAYMLDIKELPELYIMPEARINAYTFGVEKCSIAVSSGAIDNLSPDEIMSVLAHELGHIKAHHVLYKIASRILASLADSIAQKTLGVGGLMLYPIKIALLRWDRASELSSDRASLLVVKNPQIVLTSMMKLAGGSSTLNRELNVKAFIEQAEGYEKTQEEGPLGKYMAVMDSIFNTHPFPIWRAKEIIDWVESGEYFKILQGNYLQGDSDEGPRAPAGFTIDQALGSLKSWYDKKFNLPEG
jgi:Zn-dependent protease with chaperone function